MAELREIFERHQEKGCVCFKYDTRVHIGH
jgi:hypothetical protein